MDWKKKTEDLTVTLGIGGAIAVIVLICVLALALVFGALCLEGWLLMVLWNAVIPTIFIGAPTLHFWGAVGLIVICNILFKTVSTVAKGNKD